MKKKTLQAVVIALGILSASFTVSAMEKTNVENAVLPEITEESVQDQDIETEETVDQVEPDVPQTNPDTLPIEPEAPETVPDNPQPEVPDEGEDSKPESGWIEDEKGWQYKDENGNLLKDGWWEIDGEKYYFDKDGYRATDWLKTENKWYYLGTDGIMRTGWQELGGKWYYLGSADDGAMRTGWQELWGTWYYLGGADDGAMRTGWQKLWGTWYYLGGANDGAMQTGWIYPGDGKWYYAYADGAMQTGWVLTGTDDWYYAYGNGAIAINTWEKISGQWYWFDESGLMAQGWKYIGRYKYYFDKSGYMLQDLDGILGRQSSYEITVNRKRCQVMVYAKDGSNGYIIPVKTFTCSVGLPSTPTPTGTFYTPNKYRWHTLMGPSYGQYCTRINGGILFHSVAGYNKTSYNIHARDYNKLGSPASHGCVRLNVRDAKWIYDNCSLGTKVTISDSVATPFDKPATIKIPASQNWDPTDPNI